MMFGMCCRCFAMESELYSEGYIAERKAATIELFEQCKISTCSAAIRKISEVNLKSNDDIVSILADAVRNMKDTFRSIDEQWNKKLCRRELLLQLSKRKSSIQQEFLLLYEPMKAKFAQIQTEEANLVRTELHGMGFSDI